MARARHGQMYMDRTGPKGAFRLSGAFAVRVELEVSEDTDQGLVLPGPAFAQPDGPPRKVTLIKGAALEGRITLPAGFDTAGSFERFTIQLNPADGSEGGIELAHHGSNGRFRFALLTPGVYHLAVHMGGDLPLVAFNGVEVHPGQDNRDPRLDLIDLGQLMRPVVVRTTGALPGQAPVGLVLKGNETLMTWFLPSGEGRALLPADPSLTLLVETVGSRLVSLPSPGTALDDHEVHFKPGPWKWSSSLRALRSLGTARRT